MDGWDGLLIGLIEVEQRLQIIAMLDEVEEATLHYRMPVRLVPQPLYVNDDGDTVVTYAYAPREVTS
ncbi:hypothetical protein [Salinibacterium sp. ZJ454]|uniref:hypothetical protein n=1 Tax=Salinibacterium sp. ZJ454 TaxID=2708339 RepID=UPI00141F0B52|nr:hypothetical protein [Salinibacterium sp. ZJ454]